MNRASASAERTLVRRARRIVVKLGSAILAKGGARFVSHVARQMAEAVLEGRQIVVVSSGAIALGLPLMGYAKRPSRVDELQAAAAAGQPELMRRWAKAFERHGLAVAQVLLTHADLASRERYINARHALAELLRAGVVPIANENDTVATEEIKVGDNDTLSAQVAGLCTADLLILLTTADGLFDADPEKNPEARRLPVVPDADAVLELAGGAGSSGLGTGGMRTKVVAAQAATRRGVPVLIADGARPRCLSRLLAGEDLGTLFLPRSSLPSRKHWIGFTLKPQGRLVVDAGAARAVAELDKSLLPSGVLSVEGEFERGAMVEIAGPEGVVARGLAAYDSSALRALCGKQSREIAAVLGYVESPEVVHKDDLVVVPLS